MSLLTIKSVVKQKILEDLTSSVPVNNVGGGAIAGTGIGPQGEPGKHNVNKRKKPNPLLNFRNNSPTGGMFSNNKPRNLRDILGNDMKKERRNDRRPKQ